MHPATTSAPTLGRKRVVLKARPNLNITPQMQDGRRVYVVKDPVTLGYFQMEEGQRFLFDRLDGRRTLDELRQDYEQTHRPQRLSLEEIENFATQLLRSGLVENAAAGAGVLLFRRVQEQDKRRRWAWLSHLFFLRIPLCDPDRFLSFIAPVARVFFHPAAFLAGLVLLASAGALLLTRWDEFTARLPTYHEFFAWHNLLYFWLALGLVKALHELGHGLAAKAYGGEVHEAGVVFLCFFPTLYCNANDCWTIPEKWKRIAVGAAGVWVELLVAALAVFAWWLTDANTFVHNLSFALALVCGVSTVLFNGNPLMRYDGYFVLSDWLEIPNLAQVAQRQLSRTALAWFSGNSSPDATPVRSPALLCAYGLASFAYRTAVSAAMLWLFYTFMKEQRLHWVGVALVGAGASLMLAAPVLRLIESIKRIGKLPPMKKTRVLLSLGAAAAVALGFFFVPLPLHVRGIALTEVVPARQHSVMVPGAGGLLEQLFIRDGQSVRQGEVIAVLRNPDLERKLRLNEAEQTLRLDQQQALVGQLASVNGPKVDSSSYQEIDYERQSVAQQFTVLKAQQDLLTLRAPCDGKVMKLPAWEIQGKWLSPGETLCVVGDANHLQATVLVDSADRQLVETGKPAWFLVHGGQAATDGVVAQVARVDAATIPAALSGRVGGEVVTEHDPVSKTERPRKQHFLITMELHQTDARLQSGLLGEARIEAGSATLWNRTRRYLASTFQWGI